MMGAGGFSVDGALTYGAGGMMAERLPPSGLAESSVACLPARPSPAVPSGQPDSAGRDIWSNRGSILTLPIESGWHAGCDES